MFGSKLQIDFLLQAGCRIKTECEVQYVVRNHGKDSVDERIKGRPRRRWLVYLNEFDCLAADFVVLSGILTRLINAMLIQLSRKFLRYPHLQLEYLVQLRYFFNLK